MNVDLTGTNQQEFKKERSTLTSGLSIHTALAKALNQGKFALMSSLDLSSAFDAVNIDLLIKRLKIIGIPKDVIELISVWLNERTYYVRIKGGNKTFPN